MKKIILSIFFILAFGWLVSATQTISYNFNTNGSEGVTYAYPDIVKDDSVVMQIYTDRTNQVCKYDENANVNFNQMDDEFSLNYNLLHRTMLEDLNDGLYTYYIKCRADDGSVGNELKLMFSVLNPVKAEIELSKSSPVNAGVLEITLRAAKYLSQKPSLSYSLDGSNYDPIPLSGKGDEWMGYIIIPSTTGEAVGSFKFKGTDIDGSVGDEITDGDLFLIDTISPTTVDSLTATGSPDKIKLEWRMSEEVEYFNVYRSMYPGVDFSDYYQKTSSKSYTDSNVEKGKTYYYRINAVDKAGNEGGLSYEVSATVLRGDSSVNTTVTDNGLSSELEGMVDSFLSEIESVAEDVTSAKSNYAQDNKKYELMNLLKLNAVMDSSEKELVNLKNEVEGYKGQSLTRLELDKKISNARLRLNILKKKIPESVSIIDEQNFDKKPSEVQISELMMSLSGGQLSEEDKYKVKKSMEYVEKYDFSAKTYIFVFEINYLDGSKVKNTLIKEDIKTNTEKDDNLIFVENIPKEVAQKSSDISFKNSNYDVLKDDPVISFGYDNKQIIYTINGAVNIEEAKKIGTFLIYNSEIQEENTNKITGFFSFANVKSSSPLGFLILGALVLGLFLYAFFSRKNKSDNDALNEIVDKIIEAEVYIKNRDKEKSNQVYSEISDAYKNLKDKEKKEIYPEIENIYRKIKGI